MGKCLTKETAFKTPFDYQQSNTPTTMPTNYSGAPETKSMLLRQVSAPSGIETEDLTTIFRIPNDKYQCDQDVLNEKKIELMKKIDEGGFAKVFLSQDHASNTKMACKVINIGNDNEKIKINDIKNELFVLEKVKHPHIIRMYQHFIINDNLYIFMDFANSGNMFNFMQLYGVLPEMVAKKPFAQIVSGVSYMHAQRIAHRDLKLSNILLDSDLEGNLQILITDFGLSRVVYRRKKGMVLCKSYCGTPNYMAPELKRRNRYNAFMVDIYALGVMLFVILNASYPFNVKDEEKALREAINLDIQWCSSLKLTEEVKLLIRLLLEPTEENRMTMRNLIVYPWFKNEINEIQYTFPQLDQLPKCTSASKKHSSPADDIRIRDLKRRSSSEGSKSLVAGKRKSSDTASLNESAGRARRTEKSSSKASQSINNKSNRSRELASGTLGKSRNKIIGNSYETITDNQDRKGSKNPIITMTTLNKRKDPK